MTATNPRVGVRADGNLANASPRSLDRPPGLTEIRQRLADAGLQKPHVQHRYMRWFQHFALAIHFARWDRTTLEGSDGRAAILGWLATRSPALRRSLARILKSVWTQGAGLQWPLVERRDLRGLPPPRTVYPPDDEDVRRWRDGIRRLPDERERLICLFILETGVRPEQLAKLRVRDVRRGPSGEIEEIIASGADHAFKRPSDLVVQLAPGMAYQLAEWLRGSPSDDGWLVPRSRDDWSIPMTTDHIGYLFRRMARQYRLPPLTPRSLRHWVARATRRARMSEYAACLHQGWQPAVRSMHGHYGRPSIGEVLAEQERALPDGPGGTLAVQDDDHAPCDEGSAVGAGSDPAAAEGTSPPRHSILRSVTVAGPFPARVELHVVLEVRPAGAPCPDQEGTMTEEATEAATKVKEE